MFFTVLLCFGNSEKAIKKTHQDTIWTQTNRFADYMAPPKIKLAPISFFHATDDEEYSNLGISWICLFRKACGAWICQEGQGALREDWVRGWP